MFSLLRLVLCACAALCCGDRENEREKGCVCVCSCVCVAKKGRVKRRSEIERETACIHHSLLRLSLALPYPPLSLSTSSPLYIPSVQNRLRASPLKRTTMRALSPRLCLCLLVLCVAAVVPIHGDDSCTVSPAARKDCGYSGVNQQQCEAKGCCWAPVNPNPGNAPWCFYKAGPAPSPSPVPPPPPTPPGPLPGCNTYQDNHCVGDNIVTPPDFEARRWFTPRRGEPAWIAGFQVSLRCCALVNDAQHLDEQSHPALTATHSSLYIPPFTLGLRQPCGRR